MVTLTIGLLVWPLGLALFLFIPSQSAPISRRVPCEPGELVFVDCNLCTCNPQGFPNAVCARMWCQPPPKNKPMDTNELAASK